MKGALLNDQIISSLMWFLYSQTFCEAFEKQTVEKDLLALMSSRDAEFVLVWVPKHLLQITFEADTMGVALCTKICIWEEIK